jgi:hypothetical protein
MGRAAITPSAAIEFNVRALAIQFEWEAVIGLSGAARRKGPRMPTGDSQLTRSDLRSATCVGVSSDNRPACHVHTKAALARLRSGSTCSAGDRNRHN